jgi:hypothetical protein
LLKLKGVCQLTQVLNYDVCGRHQLLADVEASADDLELAAAGELYVQRQAGRSWACRVSSVV